MLMAGQSHEPTPPITNRGGGIFVTVLGIGAGLGNNTQRGFPRWNQFSVERRKPMNGRRKPAPGHLSEPTRRWWSSVVRDYELEPHHLRLLQLAAEAWDSTQNAREAVMPRKRRRPKARDDYPDWRHALEV